MKSIFFSLIFSSLWLHPAAYAAEQTVMVIGAEFWATPRHAEQVLAQAPLKAAVQQLWVEPDASLVLHYPAGESGELWGLELQAWLVSLGVASDRVALRAGYEGDDGVAVIMVTPDVSEPEMKPEMNDKESIQENSSTEPAAVTEPAPVKDEMESQ